MKTRRFRVVCICVHKFAMSNTKIVRLPAHIRSKTPAIEAPFDSCFIPKGFLFPESRDELAPYREFPLSTPFYAMPSKNRDQSVEDIFAAGISDDTDNSAFDSTILQISEMDELLLDVQGMGMQYTMHTQMCLREDFLYDFPRTWDRTQALLLNIPVFSEELCQWHYPIATMGYNVENTDPPLDINIANNYPQLFGYLPNGDLALYWEIAEILADEFNIELEPIRSTVEGSLIIMPNIAEQIKAAAPCQQVTETGIVVASGCPLDGAIAFAQQWLGRPPIVIRDAIYHFYRLRLPVIHCEIDFNPYSEATWGAFGFTSPRLSGYEFKIVNNPFAREAPIFSTEKGNIVVSVLFFERLKQLLAQFGVHLWAKLFPIQRIP